MKRIFLIIFLTNFAFCGFFDFDFCLYNCSDETNNYYNEEENQDKDKTLNDFDPNVVYKLVNHTTMDELGYHDERDIEQHLNKVKSTSLVAALSKKKITIGTMR